MANDTINSLRGATVTLACSAQGGPGNSFSWSDPAGQAIGGMVSVVTVTVSDATAGGDYVCTVMNVAGNDTATTIINGMGVQCDTA